MSNSEAVEYILESGCAWLCGGGHDPLVLHMGLFPLVLRTDFGPAGASDGTVPAGASDGACSRRCSRRNMSPVVLQTVI